MKVKRIGITEILRRVWLFSANKIKSSESFSKQPTQLIIAANNCHTKSKGLCVFFYKTCIWDSNEIRSRFFSHNHQERRCFGGCRLLFRFFLVCVIRTRKKNDT